MTSSRVLCTVIPRQSRALSFYSLQHFDSPPPPPPPPRSPPIVPARPSSSTQHSQTHQPPVQLALTPPPRNPTAVPTPPTLPFPAYYPFPFLLPPHLPILSPVPRTRHHLPFLLQSAAYGIPKRRLHPPPAPPPALDAELTRAVQVGEDAYFLRQDAMGVADGVGGWARSSPDSPSSSSPASASALFARALMHYSALELAHHPTADAVDVLRAAHARALAAFSRARLSRGSATALLAVLRGAELRVAHLGDCALCLVRDGALLYRSEEMQHAFNHPLQLGPASPTSPAAARAVALPVRPRDILILASDGMSDNLWDEDLLDEVRKFSALDSPALPRLLSQALCSRAEAETRRHTEGPFARRAREEGIKFVGGKSDDISVLVAVIAPRDPGAPAP